MAALTSDLASSAPFQVTIHHGGHIIKSSTLQYVGGRVYFVKNCMLDEWSLQEITGALKELGYTGTVKIMYAKASNSLDQLVEIKNDVDAIALARIALSKNYKNVDIYVLHGFDHGNGVVLSLTEPLLEANVSRNEVEVDEGDVEAAGQQCEESDECEESSDDSSVGNLDFEDSADDKDNDDYFNMDIAPSIADSTLVFEDGQIELPNLQLGSGALDSDYETESLDSVDLNSEGEIEPSSHPKYPKYNPVEMNVNYPWRKGLEFNSIEEFRVAMKEWCLLNGRDVKMKPNDSKRCRVKCVSEGCD